VELEFAVARALDSLAPEQREAILLKVYHGFLFEEIAEIISCPVSTVKSRIYAGFDRLRGLLAAEPAPQKLMARRR
jgi:RNA polymerase sigma-70 factor (ECF subfamily)